MLIVATRLTRRRLTRHHLQNVSNHADLRDIPRHAGTSRRSPNSIAMDGPHAFHQPRPCPMCPGVPGVGGAVQGSAGRMGFMKKTAVVTGASSGIGEATARRLAAEGFEVIAAARRLDRLEKLAAEVPGIVAVALDVTSQESVDALAASLERCDVLVNVAGGALGLESVASALTDDWQRMYEINVLGSLRMTKALLPLLVASGDGVLVMLTSTAGLTSYEGGGGYCAAKHAQRSMTETLRLELVGQPVRIIEIAPGMVHTDEFGP